MVERINKPVSVLYLSDKRSKTMMPIRVYWDGKTYNIKRVGFKYQTVKSGVPIHFFYALSEESYIKLSLNTKTLESYLEEISDGVPN